MKQNVIIILFISFFISCQKKEQLYKQQSVHQLLDYWHMAACTADFGNYFDVMTSDAVFIGTDATENWTKKDFEAYAKPHFDKGKAWCFTCIERNIYFNTTQTTAWFDELLETQMKICRGSGVAVFENGKWKIKHYVLSMTIPNEKTKEVIRTKDSIETILIQRLKTKN